MKIIERATMSNGTTIYLEDWSDKNTEQFPDLYGLVIGMNVGKLKEIIKDLPDDMPVFVACQGYCNYNFDSKQPFAGTDTFGTVYDGKLFITDDCAVDIGNGGML